MDREEAKKFAWYQNDRENIEIHIDKIYDDFESRTCENCIFALPLNLDKDKQYEFKCRLGHSDKLLNTVNKDFACNRFEAKNAN